MAVRHSVPCSEERLDDPFPGAARWWMLEWHVDELLPRPGAVFGHRDNLLVAQWESDSGLRTKWHILACPPYPAEQLERGMTVAMKCGLLTSIRGPGRMSLWEAWADMTDEERLWAGFCRICQHTDRRDAQYMEMRQLWMRGGTAAVALRRVDTSMIVKGLMG